MRAKILLVEDDTNLGMVISDQLEMLGYRVTLAPNGNEGFKQFSQGDFHLCIFDVMMPKMDGFALTEQVRKINKTIPILFLSAKNMTEDKIQGFKVGGDDYLTKPFSSEELYLRVKALLKRVDIHAEEKEDTPIEEIGKYTFDALNYILKGPNFEKKVTKKEAQILEMLCKFKNRVIDRDVILNAVWGKDDYFTGRSLDVFITKLRKYLSHDKNVKIDNIHGVGFQLICPN